MSQENNINIGPEKKGGEYNESNITKLTEKEKVIKNLGMYIGKTDVGGVTQMFYEAVSNVIDEYLQGYATKLEATINLQDESISIKDNGRGIPIGYNPNGSSTIEQMFQVLHMGGKFDAKAYVVSGGMHGVGSKLLTYVSDYLIVEVKRDGKHYRLKFEDGELVEKVHIIGDTDETGTEVIFRPSHQYLDFKKIPYGTLSNILKKQHFLTTGLHYIIKEVNSEGEVINQDEYLNTKGLTGFIDYVTEDESIRTIGNVINVDDKIIEYGDMSTRKAGELKLSLAFQYSNQNKGPQITGFTNNINQGEGGTHVNGLKDLIANAVEQACNTANLKLPKDIIKDDFLQGIVGIVSLNIQRPILEGQTKNKLGERFIQTTINNELVEEVTNLLLEDTTALNKIVDHIKLNVSTRKSIENIEKVTLKKVKDPSLDPDNKLVDAESKDRKKCELFITEGDSAGGGIEEMRDSQFQAIYKLKGKPLNSVTTDAKRLFDNKELRNLVYAIGTGIGKDFDIDKLRYKSIYILSDGDSVTGDSLVTIKDSSGNIQVHRIEDFEEYWISNPRETYYIKALDQNTGKISWQKILKYLKKDSRKDLYKITDSLSKEIKVTGDHSLVVYNSLTKKIETKLTKDVNEKVDYLIGQTKDNYFRNLSNNPIYEEVDSYLTKVKLFFKKDFLLQYSKNKGLYYNLRVVLKNKFSSIEYFNRKKKERKLTIQQLLKKSSKTCNIHTLNSRLSQNDENYLTLENFLEILDKLGCNLTDLEVLKQIDFLYLKVNGGESFKKYKKLNYLEDIKSQTGTSLPVGKFELDKDFFFFLGYYLSDGCNTSEKDNPNSFTISFGREKFEYNFERLSNTLNKTLGCQFYKNSEDQNYIDYSFQSPLLRSLLSKWGILQDKGVNKKVPKLIQEKLFNSRECCIGLLSGFLSSDSSISGRKGEKEGVYFSFSNTSLHLIDVVKKLCIYLGLAYKELKEVQENKNGKTLYYLSIGNLTTKYVDEDLLKEFTNYLDLKESKDRTKFCSPKEIEEEYHLLYGNDTHLYSITSLQKLSLEELEKYQYVYDLEVENVNTFECNGNIIHNSDGNHISTLLLGFFKKYMPQLLQKKVIYKVVPPLYGITEKNGNKIYLKDRKALEDYQSKNSEGSYRLIRFKGLGEMNPIELYETCVKKENRISVRVTDENTEENTEFIEGILGSSGQFKFDFLKNYETKDVTDVKKTSNEEIEEITSEMMYDYGMYVNQDRAIPNLEDGLKPVHTRLLWAMKKMGITSSGKTVKSARVVGETIGKYHPHGNVAVYGASVKLTQDFYTQFPLLNKNGNFGSLFGFDSYASDRYTELKLSKFTEDILLKNLNEKTPIVKFRPNYDGEFLEPEYLPSCLPIVLLLPTFGIGVGMSSDIPPHNINEVIEALIGSIKEKENFNPTKYIKGPDFPVNDNEIINSEEEIKRVYNERGSFRYRVKLDYDEKKNTITINSLSYGVEFDKIFKTLLILVKGEKRISDGKREKVIPLPYQKSLKSEIKKVQNFSGRAGKKNGDLVKIVLTLAKGVNIDVVKAKLYKLTELEKSVSFRPVLINRYRRIKKYNLKQIIEEFLIFRRETLINHFNNKIEQLTKDKNVLTLKVKVIDNLQFVIDTITDGESDEDIKTILSKELSITLEEGEYILSMPLRSIKKLEKTSLLTKIKEYESEIDKFIGLRERDQLDKYIIDELKDIKKKYGVKRNTEIVGKQETVKIDSGKNAYEKKEVHIFLGEKDGLLVISKVSGRDIKIENRWTSFYEEYTNVKRLVGGNRDKFYLVQNGQGYFFPIGEIGEESKNPINLYNDKIDSRGKYDFYFVDTSKNKKQVLVSYKDGNIARVDLKEVIKSTQGFNVCNKEVNTFTIIEDTEKNLKEYSLICRVTDEDTIICHEFDEVPKKKSLGTGLQTRGLTKQFFIVDKYKGNNETNEKTKEKVGELTDSNEDNIGTEDLQLENKELISYKGITIELTEDILTPKGRTNKGITY